jgi:hypothetical protein
MEKIENEAGRTVLGLIALRKPYRQKLYDTVCQERQDFAWKNGLRTNRTQDVHKNIVGKIMFIVVKVSEESDIFFPSTAIPSSLYLYANSGTAKGSRHLRYKLLFGRRCRTIATASEDISKWWVDMKLGL